MKMHVAALGNDKIWPKCPSTDPPIWTFINDIQELIFDLVATIRSDKCGGTTGHLGLVMSLAEFALLNPTAPLFPCGTHPGVLDFTGATTVNQHTERRLEHEGRLRVFKLDQMIEEQCKKHVMSCYHKDIYCGLKDTRLGYINITTAHLFEYLYAEYGDKTEKLQNKALDDMEDPVDLTGPSINPFRLRLEKLLLFLSDTEQSVLVGRYIVIYLQVIEKSNFINKVVLAWRRRDAADRTIALFWPFIKEAHKKQRLKLTQGNDEQANSVMQQKKLQDMALKITQLKRYADDQNKTLDDIIDKVNDEASRSDRSIPGVIDTSGTSLPSESSALSTAQAFIVSLTARVAEVESRRYVPSRDNRRGPGRGGDRGGDERGRGGDRRRPTPGELGTIDETKDRRLTRKEKEDHTVKQCKNKNYCHTHGYKCVDRHNSAHCMYPEKGHKTSATAENPIGGCMLYKRLYTAYCLECPG